MTITRFLNQHSYINFVNVSSNKWSRLSNNLKRYSFPLYPGYVQLTQNNFTQPIYMQPNFHLRYKVPRKRLPSSLVKQDDFNFYPLDEGKLHVSIPILDFDTVIELNKDCVISVCWDEHNDLKSIDITQDNYEKDCIYVV
jgi:hypothetical protein